MNDSSTIDSIEHYHRTKNRDNRSINGVEQYKTKDKILNTHITTNNNLINHE